ncbi:amidohydrolase [Mangrovicoccus sp. HB161399]|uniref:amidohydrolase n=1 Tax=Mangrovicoccus sp. HB161399 TaxID=2720392 RepID=UPI001554EA58|nr:amidohydrolase [Mangrovicoccus sp. HB161399]
MAERLVLSGAVLPDGTAADIVIADGRIAQLAAPGTAAGPAEDCTGMAALPGLADAHIHLDKTLWGLPFEAHARGGTVAERIAFERSRRPSLPPVFGRGLALARHVAALGTTQVRSHVDIDTQSGLSGLFDLLRLREAVRDLVDIQIVAFPQSGILRDPGTAELLDAALREGADLVGGLDPSAIDGDAAGHLDIVFGLAERHGKGIDIHLHEPGAAGLGALADIARRTGAAAMQGRVAVSHAFALGHPAAGPAVDALARAGVAIVTNGPPRAVAMPPVAALQAAGVLVAAGSDNIRDLWSPHGNGDMLQRAGMIAYMQGLCAPEELELALALATSHGAALCGSDGGRIAPGGAADMVLVAAGSAAEALVSAPPRRMVIKRGRIIARDGKLES